MTDMFENLSKKSSDGLKVDDVKVKDEASEQSKERITIKPDVSIFESISFSSLREMANSVITINSLKGKSEATENKHQGLTEEEKSKVKEAHPDWPDEIIDAIGSWEEYEIYDKAGLKCEYINGRPCLVRSDIDMDQKDDFGLTNRERMERGLSPISKNGETIELHHIGQKANSPLAELTTTEHRGTGNYSVLHDGSKPSEIDREKFNTERQEHWKSRSTNS